MEIWRVTFTTVRNMQLEVFNKKIEEKKETKDNYMELRNFSGELIRLGNNSNFSLEETVLGLRPVIGGEVYSKMHPTKGPHKYRTSCWTGAVLDEHIESFYRQIDKENDEIYALKGAQIIFEFDENNKPFVLGAIEEGQKLNLKINNNTDNIRKRYDPTISDIKGEEYDYILKNFIDNRNFIK